MRSIERRFNYFKEKNPQLGEFPTLMRAVRGQGFSKETISDWFSKLLAKDDYSKGDRKYLIQELVNFTNYPEDTLF